MNSGDGNDSLDLLRLPNYRMTGSREEDGKFIIEVRTQQPKISPCCLLRKLVKTGSTKPRFRDLPHHRQPTYLEVRRQRYKCNECGAALTEIMPDLVANREMTERFWQQLSADAVHHSFVDAARINGVHETLVRRVFEEYADQQLPADYLPKMPKVLGMDEIYLHGKPRFIIGDVKNRSMLDLQPARRDLNLRAYFEPMADRSVVEVVTQDMWRGYASITKRMFPNARTVIDKWHVQRTGNYGVEAVRKDIAKRLPDAVRVSLKGKKDLLLVRWDDASEARQDQLADLLGRYPRLQAAYTLKEQFYDIYMDLDKDAAAERMTAWAASVPPEMQRPFKEALDAIKNWRPHILRYFEFPYTNAYVEGLNSLVRKMNVAGSGYTFDVLRKKAILKHGKAGAQFRPAPETERKARPTKGGIGDRYVKALLGIPISAVEADFDAGTF